MNITSAAGKKLLRCGYTTGTCAALGAAGAARLLLTGKAPESVGLRTPKGIVVEVAPIYCRKNSRRRPVRHPQGRRGTMWTLPPACRS